MLLNIANGIHYSSVFGIAARLPTKYMSAVVLGTNLGYAIIAIVCITLNFITTNSLIFDVYILTTSLVVLLLCFSAHIVLQLNVSYVNFFSIYNINKIYIGIYIYNNYIKNNL